MAQFLGEQTQGIRAIAQQKMETTAAKYALNHAHQWLNRCREEEVVKDRGLSQTHRKYACQAISACARNVVMAVLYLEDIQYIYEPGDGITFALSMLPPVTPYIPSVVRKDFDALRKKFVQWEFLSKYSYVLS